MAVMSRTGSDRTQATVDVRLLDRELPPPSYAHPGDAGLDLYASRPVELKPFERALVPTGVAVSIPEGFAGFVQPRSGRAIEHGLALVNSPGLIDSNYRGEIKVIAVNLDPSSTIVISRGDKVAQLVIQPVVRATIVCVEELDQTGRGEGGFGSTGR